MSRGPSLNQREVRQVTRQLVGRALRTLMKRGDTGALALLGFGQALVDVTNFGLDHDTVSAGETLAFTATLTNVGTRPRGSIDYVVHHRKPQGVRPERR